MANFETVVSGLKDLDSFKNLKQDIRLAAVRSINKTARDKRAKAARVIRDQINFPASYVSPGQKRLYVSKQANRGDMEAKITAQFRATSLARFMTGSPKPGKAGVNVVVQPGKARYMKRAFVIHLPGIGGSTDPGLANSFLALRLKPGERIGNKTTAVRVSKGLYILYGPSVSQAFISNDGTGVASDMVPEIEKKLVDEFLRLLNI